MLVSVPRINRPREASPPWQGQASSTNGHPFPPTPNPFCFMRLRAISPELFNSAMINSCKPAHGRRAILQPSRQRKHEELINVNHNEHNQVN